MDWTLSVYSVCHPARVAELALQRGDLCDVYAPTGCQAVLSSVTASSLLSGSAVASA